MPNSFSAFFESKLEASVVNSITYKLIVGSLDCTDEMKDLPKITRETGKVISENTPISLIRSDALINSLGIQTFDHLSQPVAFGWGFVTASGTDDTTQLLAGRVGGMTIADDTIEVNVVDGNNYLSRILCSNTSGTLIINPSYMWWYLMTENVGLSSVEDSSNPDIDYDAWKVWSDFNESEVVSYRVMFKRNYENKYALDLQEKIMKLASAAVFHDGAGRLVTVGWHKRTSAGSLEVTDSEIVGDIETVISDDHLVNRIRVSFYNLDGYEEDFATYQEDSSVNSWGLRAVDIDTYDDYIQLYDWDSPTHTYLSCPSLAAKRMVQMADHPDELVKYKIKTNISGLRHLPEDAITLVTSRDNLGSRDLTIRKVEYDLNDGLVRIELIGRSIS